MAAQSFLAVLRFVLELILIAVYASFGFRLDQSPLMGLDWILGVGMVMLVLRTQAVWGVALFVIFAFDRVLLDRLGKPAWAEPR